MIKVSIIVPIYNSERTLERCINSILEQTFTNFELLLINDGSTDYSALICDKFTKQDKRIKVFHQNNQGVSYTRNIGLEHAAGEYIYFIDADDWIEPDILERMVISMENGNDLVICGYNRIIMGSEENYRCETITCESALNKDLKGFMEGFSVYYNQGIVHALWNKLYKRDIIHQNSIKFDKYISLGEDLIFNMNYIKKCNAVSMVSAPLYNYIIYQNNQSLSTQYNPKRLETQIMIHERIIDLLKYFNVYNDSNKKFVNKSYSAALLGAIKNYLGRSPDNAMLKKKYLKKVIRDNNVINKIGLFNQSIDKNIIALLLRLRLLSLLIVITKSKSTVSRMQ